MVGRCLASLHISWCLLSDNRVAFVRQVKEASDIAEVLATYLPLHGEGPVYKALCPFHNDRRPSLDIDTRRQRYRCWACGAHGDVFNFVQEYDKVAFPEAMAILARRAGIALPESPTPDTGRLRLLETMHWATERYQECLLEAPGAEAARAYLGQRQLLGATVRRFGLGFAPLAGDWLAQLARHQGIAMDDLCTVGLLGERQASRGFYDRFRDRVMFPIRDIRGQTVGFGGRILPDSPYAIRAPKYYNSTETPLFNKRQLLYGLDLARHAAGNAGCLAVVEGYTDVLMAHQLGVSNVVATMGTALTPQHVQLLRRYVSRVVLIYDADAGGLTGVDRALELFVSQDVELAIAMLPDGRDPCDYLLEQGAASFTTLLHHAVDALDFKLNQLLARSSSQGVEGTRRVVDGVLGIIALAPRLAGPSGRVKQELLITRIAQRLGLRQETVWARLGELIAVRASHSSGSAAKTSEPTSEAPRAAPAPRLERQLLEVLLAEPALVARAARQLPPERITHPGLRKLYQGLIELYQAGEPPDLDNLRVRLQHPALIAKALELQEVGQEIGSTDPEARPHWLGRILLTFDEQQREQTRHQLRDQLTGIADHDTAMELLRRLQTQPPHPEG